MSEFESSGDKPRDIGLKAVQEARVARARSKHGRISAKAWLLVLGTIVPAVFLAWLFRERSLAAQKEELLSKQRAAVTTVGAEWAPLRDAIEKVAQAAAAGPYEGDRISPDVAHWDFRSRPGIYLRMRVEDAKDVETLRHKAKDSARDAFVGCLFRQNNPSAAAIARGEDAGSSGWQDQPWNLRLAYQATRVLRDEWAAEAKNAEDELHLRVFVQQYEKAKNEEIPLAIDIIKRAEFFLVALDEDVPAAEELAPDAGPITAETLQQVLHPVRVTLVNLKTGQEVVRLRREVEADFLAGGQRSVQAPEVLAAMKRQVNNCALARSVWSAIEPAMTDAGAE